MACLICRAQRSIRRKQLPLAAPSQQEPPERSQQPPGQQAQRGSRAAAARRASAPPANMLLRRKSMGRLGGEEAAVFSPGAASGHGGVGREEGAVGAGAAGGAGVPNAIGNRGQQLSNLMQASPFLYCTCLPSL